MCVHVCVVGIRSGSGNHGETKTKLVKGRKKRCKHRGKESGVRHQSSMELCGSRSTEKNVTGTLYQFPGAVTTNCHELGA